MRCFRLLVVLLILTVGAFELPAYPPKVSLAEVRTLIDAARPVHPRLLTTQAELAALKRRAADDPSLASVAKVVLGDADAMLRVAPIERELEGRRLLGESRRAVRRLLTLAMAYHLSGIEVYVERTAREMRAIAAFPDWNPSHFWTWRK